MELIKFMGAGDGNVDDPSVLHYHHPLMGGEYTLCGITLDGDDKTGGEYMIVKAKAVTCHGCATIIRGCRGVRVAPNAK